jgi:phospholipid-translocating P-type ATPase (flippase)
MSSNKPVVDEFHTIEVNNKSDAVRVDFANAISTTKYSWYSWLPKSIWEQFRRIANIYFLLISVLMLIGTYATEVFVSPLNPYSTIVTLVFVLLVTSIKEGVEDLKRAHSDDFENNRDVIVVTFGPNGEEIQTVKKSKHVNPGDIIKLVGHCAIPVDMLLVLTSLSNDGNKCYIETANLDGETNLKVREAPPLLAENFASQVQAGKAVKELFDGSIEIQAPNKNIHKCTGNLTLRASKEVIPVSIDNILLRSCSFSNTDWGYGVAIYTGQFTKIQMNNRQAPSKMSKLEHALNNAIIMIFMAQIIFVSFSVASIWYTDNNRQSSFPYVFPPNQPREGDSVLPLAVEQWFVFLLLYNNFIPISLYVTIELVNIGQAYFVQNDEKMYREELDVTCQVRSSNLLQELGMVSNIFSDKTGTLTRNEMKLVKFVLNGAIYDIRAPDGKSTSMEDIFREFGPNRQAFIDFATCLALCHTVVREKNGNYRAESPDELALVEGIAGYDCGLLERGSKEMIVNLFGRRCAYEALAVNPFNADRKRMSILVRNTETNEYLVLCKGADNIMLPLCDLQADEERSLNKSLLDLANFGLRTLVIAMKKLSASEAQSWLSNYKAATVSTLNREENIARVGAELEMNMRCLGLTAIEDRLQDEVPEVIADLAKAGIILWMLTGDKLETAINIGHSCNLLLNDTLTHILSGAHSHEDFVFKLTEIYNKIMADPGNKNVALVLDGKSFAFFDPKDKEQRKMLYVVGQGVRSVIACRLTPTQKREIVHLVKTESTPRATTLAIGDGANDVSMILEGDVGVGIYGKEGRQAANNADFAIGEFKFLRRLVLVHGRWNYIRQAIVFLYSMHKNMVITMTLFWYSYYSAVSGTTLYESWIYTGFNFILGLPIIVFGILDRDLSEEFVLRNPFVYNTSKHNSLLVPLNIGAWIFNAMIYAVVFCLLVYLVGWDTFYTWGVFDCGTVIFTALCNTLQMKVAFYHHQWAWPHALAMFISVGGMLLYFLIIAVSTWEYYYIANQVYLTGFFWFFSFFTVPLFTVYIDWVNYYTRLMFLPKIQMLYEESEILVRSNKLLLVNDEAEVYKEPLDGAHNP